MAVTFYSSEDAGAIQSSYSGSTGAYQTNIIDIMDSILINGYGDKLGLGWTKLMTSEVAGSDRTVYRNQSAYESNCFLLIESIQKAQGYIQFQGSGLNMCLDMNINSKLYPVDQKSNDNIVHYFKL